MITGKDGVQTYSIDCIVNYRISIIGIIIKPMPWSINHHKLRTIRIKTRSEIRALICHNSTISSYNTNSRNILRKELTFRYKTRITNNVIIQKIKISRCTHQCLKIFGRNYLLNKLIIMYPIYKKTTTISSFYIYKTIRS